MLSSHKVAWNQLRRGTSGAALGVAVRIRRLVHHLLQGLLVVVLTLARPRCRLQVQPFLNPVAQRILDRSASRLAGQPAEHALRDWPALLQFCREPALTEMETVLRVEGSQRTYHLRASPLTNRRGRDIGRLVIMRDVTERRRAQTQLLQQQRALAALEEHERLGRELHDSWPTCGS